MGALTVDRKALAVTQAAVGGQVHQTLDIHRGFAAEVTFHDVVAVDGLADLEDFGVAQLVHPAGVFNAHLLNDVARLGRADTVDVLQRDDDALVGGDVDACDTGHVSESPDTRKSAKAAQPSDITRMEPTRLSRSFAEGACYMYELSPVNGDGWKRGRHFQA